MTLTQLGAFVLVARLGSVTGAARALGVSEPAVSQALGALRRHLGDELVVREASGMVLTPGGRRLVAIASQMVSLGTEAEAAIRAARGAPDQLRVVAQATIAEYLAPGLLDAFERRSGSVETSVGAATSEEMGALVQERLADVALGPALGVGDRPGVESHPVMRSRLVVAAAPGRHRLGGRPTWLVDPSFADPAWPVAALLARFRVRDDQIRVFPSQAAAVTAGVEGEGVVPVLEALVGTELARGVLCRLEVPGTRVDLRWYASMLEPDRRSPAASSFRAFLGTPPAIELMHRPRRGQPPSRFRPPVYVTIWSS